MKYVQIPGIEYCLANCLISSLNSLIWASAWMASTKSVSFLPEVSWMRFEIAMAWTHQPAILSISASLNPRVVRAGVPSLIPPGLIALKGIRSNYMWDLRLVAYKWILVHCHAYCFQYFLNLRACQVMRSYIPHNHVAVSPACQNLLASTNQRTC